MKKKVIRVIDIIAIFFILIQFGSWAITPLIYKTGDEFPLSEIQGFVVDKNENIIVGLGFYQIIQVYNKNGDFVTSWRPETNGGSFQLFLGIENSIVVLPARYDREIYYNQQGIEINGKRTVDKVGIAYKENYRLMDDTFFPKIVKHAVNHEQIIVEQSIIKNLLKAPFPFFGFGLICFLFFWVRKAITTLVKYDKQKQ